MKDEATDQPVFKRIQELAAEEHRLFKHPELTNADRSRLAEINVELDQCWAAPGTAQCRTQPKRGACAAAGSCRKL